MGDSGKRCEKCNTPIDDGKLCSTCQLNVIKPLGIKYTKEETAFRLEQGKIVIRDAHYEYNHPTYDFNKK